MVDKPNALVEPPHSIEAEQSVLGSLMLDSRHIDDVLEMLKEEDFYHPQHQYIFAAIHSLHLRAQPCDAVKVNEKLKDQGHEEDSGGLDYLGELTLGVISSDLILGHAELVRQRSLLRQMFETGQRISAAALAPGERDSDELLDEAEQQLFAIHSPGEKAGPKPAANFAASVIDQLHDFMQKGSGITGLSTGFSNLDALTTGLHAGDLVVIAGRPGMGKTSFAMNLVESAVLQSDVAALVFSMEMASEQLVMRLFSSLGKVNQQHLRNGRIGKQEWGAIDEVVKQIDSMHLFIDDSQTLTPGEIRSRSRKLARNLPKGVQLGLVMVDYIQLMHLNINKTSENRVNEVSEITRQLKALAKELKAPVVALSQLNRSLETRQDKRPVMSDLRESGSIEQDADTIMFIYREGYYNRNAEDGNETEINVAKQRNGPTDVVRLYFEGAYTRFKEGASPTPLPGPETYTGTFGDL